MRPLLCAAVCLLLCVRVTSAAEDVFDVQKWPQAKLEQAITAADAKLFDIGFNQCNFAIWQDSLADYLEFFDDRTGLNTDRDREVAAFHDRCPNGQSRVIRKLIRSEAYPLNRYGAVQLGEHGFYAGDNPEKLLELAQFVIVWHWHDGVWQVSRVISYDHKPPAAAN